MSAFYFGYISALTNFYMLGYNVKWICNVPPLYTLSDLCRLEATPQIVQEGGLRMEYFEYCVIGFALVTELVLAKAIYKFADALSAVAAIAKEKATPDAPDVAKPDKTE